MPSASVNPETSYEPALEADPEVVPVPIKLSVSSPTPVRPTRLPGGLDIVWNSKNTSSVELNVAVPLY